MAVAERELTDLSLLEEPRLYRWTREQFYQLGEIGLFNGQRVELMEGEIIQMPPIGLFIRELTRLLLICCGSLLATASSFGSRVPSGLELRPIPYQISPSFRDQHVTS